MFWPTVVVIAMAVLVNGCGFRSLYAKRDVGNVTSLLTQVTINPIGDRIGQILRNILIDRTIPNGASDRPRYRLSVRLTQNTQDLNVRKDNTASRANLAVTAHYYLQDLKSSALNPIVFTDTAQIVVSYNILEVYYATIVARQEAQTLAAQCLADTIVTRLAVHALNTDTHLISDVVR